MLFPDFEPSRLLLPVQGWISAQIKTISRLCLSVERLFGGVGRSALWTQPRRSQCWLVSLQDGRSSKWAVEGLSLLASPSAGRNEELGGGAVWGASARGKVVGGLRPSRSNLRLAR